MYVSYSMYCSPDQIFFHSLGFYILRRGKYDARYHRGSFAQLKPISAQTPSLWSKRIDVQRKLLTCELFQFNGFGMCEQVRGGGGKT